MAKKYKYAAGTKVRVNGEAGTLVIEWLAWESTVSVMVAGHVMRVHPTKVWLDGNTHLPYEA